MTTATRSRPKKRTPAPPADELPILENGDRMTRAEFRAIYERLPGIRAELIEGQVYIHAFYDHDRKVYVASPVNHRRHGGPHFHLGGWLYNYKLGTDGADAGDNSSLHLDVGENEPQPDLFLRILPDHGGQSRDAADGNVEGAPELIAEIAASSKSYDLHAKLAAYQRNGVCEYIVWRTQDRAVDWFVMNDGKFRRHTATKGVLRSIAFPGLWLDATALIENDHRKVQRVLREGMRSADHATFVRHLAKRR